MSWTTPRTYVDMEIPTAAILNADIRDNLLAADQHAHTGVSGDGSATLDSLDYIDFDHQSGLAAPAAGHARFWMASDGTVRFRNTGGSEKTASDTTHAHTQADIQEATASQDIGGDPGASYTNNETAAMTPTDSTGSAKHIITEAASSAFLNDSGVSGRTCFMRTLKDSVQQTEVSAGITSGVNDTLRLMISDVHINLANASTDFEQEVKVSSTGVSSHSQTVIVQEVRSQ